MQHQQRDTIPDLTRYSLPTLRMLLDNGLVNRDTYCRVVVQKCPERTLAEVQAQLLEVVS